MGEAKRRKKLDPSWGKGKTLYLTISQAKNQVVIKVNGMDEATTTFYLTALADALRTAKEDVFKSRVEVHQTTDCVIANVITSNGSSQAAEQMASLLKSQLEKDLAKLFHSKSIPCIVRGR